MFNKAQWHKTKVKFLIWDKCIMDGEKHGNVWKKLIYTSAISKEAILWVIDQSLGCIGDPLLWRRGEEYLEIMVQWWLRDCP